MHRYERKLWEIAGYVLLVWAVLYFLFFIFVLR